MKDFKLRCALQKPSEDLMQSKIEPSQETIQRVIRLQVVFTCSRGNISKNFALKLLPKA
jgi:hypothetical protein